MKKIVLFFVLTCLCVVLSAETQRLYIQSVSVSSTKTNGNSWDYSDKADLKIEIHIKSGYDWVKKFESPIFQDTEWVDIIMNTQLDLDSYSKIRINVLDADSFQNDEIGSTDVSISQADFSSLKELSFGNVTSLTYFLSPHQTLKEHYDSLETNYQQKFKSQWAEMEKIKELLAKEKTILAKEQNRLELWSKKLENSNSYGNNDNNNWSKERQDLQDKITKWRDMYNAKVGEYDTTLAQRDKWRNMHDEKDKQYGNVVNERDKWKNSYDSLSQQSGSYQQAQQKWQKMYDEKVGEYNNTLAQRDKWRNMYDEKDKQYGNIVSERDKWKNSYDSLSQQSGSYQQDQQKWQKMYDEKVGEYNNTLAQCDKWRNMHDEKSKEYDNTLAQRDKWKNMYDEKNKECDNIIAERDKWKNSYDSLKNSNQSSNNYNNSNQSNNYNNSNQSEKGEVTQDEKTAQEKLKGIFRWTASSYTRQNVQKMTDYYEQAKPYADILKKYPHRNQEWLKQFVELEDFVAKLKEESLTKDIDKGLFSLKYNLKKNQEWLTYYKDNPQETEKIQPYQVENIVQGFAINIENGDQQLIQIEQKYGTSHSLIVEYKQKWSESKEEVNKFLSQFISDSTTKKFEKQIAEITQTLQTAIQNYKPGTTSPISFTDPLQKLVELYQQAQQELGENHSALDQIKDVYVVAQKWAVVAFCDTAINARQANNDIYMNQNFANAKEIIGQSKTLLEYLQEQQNRCNRWIEAEKELVQLRTDLLERIKRSSNKLSKRFQKLSYKFKFVKAKRQNILDNLVYDKGKALEQSHFKSLSWSETGWILQHDGDFAYSWDSDIWKKFREIELDQYRIFREYREKILKKYNVFDLGVEGHIDWKFPGLTDITFIATVDGSTTYTPKRKVYDNYGRVIAEVNDHPVRVPEVKIVAIKSTYFTLWKNMDSHEKMNLKNLIKE